MCRMNEKVMIFWGGKEGKGCLWGLYRKMQWGGAQMRRVK